MRFTFSQLLGTWFSVGRGWKCVRHGRMCFGRFVLALSSRRFVGNASMF